MGYDDALGVGRGVGAFCSGRGDRVHDGVKRGDGRGGVYGEGGVPIMGFEAARPAPVL